MTLRKAVPHSLGRVQKRVHQCNAAPARPSPKPFKGSRPTTTAQSFPTCMKDAATACSSAGPKQPAHS